MLSNGFLTENISPIIIITHSQSTPLTRMYVNSWHKALSLGNIGLQVYKLKHNISAT